MIRRAFVNIATMLYVFLFVYTAASKLSEYERFAVQLGQSEMLTRFATELAWLVPGAELVISVLLIIPASQLVGLYAAFTMMVMFTSYIVFTTQFSDYVPCSCGGVIEKLSWSDHITFNLAFMIISVLAILLYARPRLNSRLIEDKLSGTYQS